jgi:hypothetical protein
LKLRTKETEEKMRQTKHDRMVRDDGILCEILNYNVDGNHEGIALRYVGGFQPYVTHAFTTHPDGERGYFYGNYYVKRHDAERDFADRATKMVGAHI